MEPYVCLLMGCVMERQTVRMVLTKDFAVVRNSIELILIIFYGVVCHLLLFLIRKQDTWMTGWICIKVKTCRIWTATFGSLNSSIIEDTCLLGCFTTLSCEYFSDALEECRALISGSSNPRSLELLDCSVFIRNVSNHVPLDIMKHCRRLDPAWTW